MSHGALFPAARAWDDVRASYAKRRAVVDGPGLFEMLDIPVLQVYGLTETCAICTMDMPKDATVGRVGHAIEGVELRLSEEGEILVKGPNVFGGYWRNEDATRAAFAGEWFHTGDRGDEDTQGRWRILGRAKSLLVPSSGHRSRPSRSRSESVRSCPARATSCSWATAGRTSSPS
jgi:long-chain acyl-CoA synthetase